MDQPGTSRQDQEGIIEDLSNSDAELSSKELVKVFTKLNEIVETGDVSNFKKFINILHTVPNKILVQQCITKNDFDLFTLISQYSQADMLEYLLDQTQLLPYLSPVDKGQRDRSIETTFFNCMLKGDVTLLEKFYDHWAGDLHWVYNKASSVNDNENLSNLCILLSNADEKFKNSIAVKLSPPQKLADIRCIVLFNEFQIDLYEKLDEVKRKIDEWEDIVDYNESTRREIELIKEIIEIIFKQHENYSNRVIAAALDRNNHDDDGISLYWKAHAFYMYKTFFWKTDYNICLLILDNIHLLKKRLILEKNTYQKFESKIYHFIYHFKTKWTFYLSKTGVLEGSITSTTDNGENHIFNTRYSIDVGGLITYLILYLERDHFIKTLRSFKEELNKPISDTNIRPVLSKFTDEEIQPLTLCPEMRDDYSLKKMSRYLQELPSVSDIKKKKEWSLLLLERILQVVGEFLKSTKETMNLEPTTRSLIMAEVPIDVVDSLNDIRDYLSKAKECKILWRMEIAKHGAYIFEKVLQDLLHLRDAIKKVISINRYFVNRSLIKFGFEILSARNDDIHEKINMPEYMYNCCSRFLGGALYHEFGKILLDDFYRKQWSVHGLSRCLMLEVAQIDHDFNMLDKKRYQEIKRIQTFLTKNFPHYKNVIQDLLQKVMYQNEQWKKMKDKLSEQSDITICDYPNCKDVSNLKQHLNSINKNDDTQYLFDFIENYTDVEALWDHVQRLLEFLIIKTKAFDNTTEEIKYSMFTNYYKQVCIKGYKHEDTEYNVKKILTLIENHCSPKVKSSNSNDTHVFDGIKEFNEILNMKQFITEEEIRYICNNIPECHRTKELIFHNIGKNFCADMERNIKTALSIKPFDKSSEKIIRSLSVADRDPELLKCYLERVTLLSKIINEQQRDFLIIRYKYNAQFRICLEMILIDLLNISAKCKRIEIIQKHNNLLTEINMRNVLAHGNALLEVVGQVLDTNDLPGEIINKSLEFIDDLESVRALYELKRRGFDFENIDRNGNYDNARISHIEKKLFDKLKESKHWRSYLQLVPEYVDHVWSVTKKLREQESKEKLKLIEAVKINEDIEKLSSIMEKVNINYVDDVGNAAIHYAAMNGNQEIVTELIKKMANIDIKNEDNKMTALHYAALKGHSDVVKYLIESGAKIEKDKQGYTYKDIEERQAEASKKRMEERPEELDFDSDDFKLFDMDD